MLNIRNIVGYEEKIGARCKKDRGRKLWQSNKTTSNFNTCCINTCCIQHVIHVEYNISIYRHNELVSIVCQCIFKHAL